MRAREINRAGRLMILVLAGSMGISPELLRGGGQAEAPRPPVTNGIEGQAVARAKRAEEAARRREEARKAREIFRPAPGGAGRQPGHPGGQSPAARETKGVESQEGRGRDMDRARGVAETPGGGRKAVSPRRDPFRPLIGQQGAGTVGTRVLPPGKAGLLVATTSVEGMIRSPNGMIAVVSTPDQRVYFLRVGDQIYDGRVEQIGMNQVIFRQQVRDVFGKPIERMVTKRLTTAAGEGQ